MTKNRERGTRSGGKSKTKMGIISKLHNILRYVNKCNYLHNRLCLNWGQTRIFRFKVNIKY